MATTVTIQRGQGTVTAVYVGTSGGYPNGNGGTSLTMVTAPSSGVSRIILNQLSIFQTTPNPFPSGGGTDVPGAGISANVYLGNNYNGDGSTRYFVPVANTTTNASIAKIAFPAGTFNSGKFGSGTGTIQGTAPLYASPAGINAATYTWFNSLLWNQWPANETAQLSDGNTTCVSPNNIYLGPNDTLSIKVSSGLTGNTVTLPIYTVTYSFTLITET